MNHPTDQFDLYLFGGLSPQERLDVETHLAACEDCQSALAAARQADVAMNHLFAGVQPGENFENTMIQALRLPPPMFVMPRIHPMVRRAAIGVAATVMVGVIGYLGSSYEGRQVRAVRLFQHNVSVAATSESATPYHAGAGFEVAHGIENRSGEEGRDHTWVSARYPTPGAPLGGSATLSVNGGITGAGTLALGSQTPSGVTYGATGSGAITEERNANFYANVGTNNGAVISNVGTITNSGAMGAAENFSDPKSRQFNVSGIGNLTKTGAGTLTLSGTNTYSGATTISSGALQVGGGGGGSGGGNFSGVISGSSGLTKTGGSDFLYGKSEPGIAGNTSLSVNGMDKANLDAPSASNLIVGEGRIGISNGSNTVLQLPKSGTDAYITPLPFSVAPGQQANGPAQGQPGSPANHTAVAIDDTTGRTSQTDSEGNKTLGSDAPGLAKDGSGRTEGTSGQAAPPGDYTATANAHRPADPVAPPATNLDAARPKIIRTGEMEFEVDGFDAAFVTISKIVTEEASYIATTNSEKLPTGKVHGSIVLRVPPERLDTLVLKLRGIGDLVTQNIRAQDITKQYTDLESQLRAATAMHERLLEIIKSGKGEVKDLLEAEKQVGEWREKVETIEGEIRFYNNQIALCTLTLTLTEREAHVAAVVSETETVNMTMETEKVEDAWQKAKDAISEAKGRVVTSQLKRFDAGRFGGQISARISPDVVDAVVAKVKLAEGRVTSFDRERSQATSNGTSPTDPRNVDAPTIKREDMMLNITFYNLANFGPRRTSDVKLVAADVDEAYHALIDQVRSAGGQVIRSHVDRAKADEASAELVFTVPTDKADVLLSAVRGSGEVLKSISTENPDAQNVTDAKRGFTVVFGSLPSFAARETQRMELATLNVPTTFKDLVTALGGTSSRVVQSHLTEGDRGTTAGTIECDIPRASMNTFEAALNKSGQIVTRLVDRSTDTENTVDSKIHLALTVSAAETLAPRQISDLAVDVADVQKAIDDTQAAALAVGGRQLDGPVTANDGSGHAAIVLDVPMDRINGLIDQIDAMGKRKSRQTMINSNSPDGKLARARLAINFNLNTPTVVQDEDSALFRIRHGWETSLQGLSSSASYLLIGTFLVLPWALPIWLLWRAGRRWKSRRAAV